VTTATGAETIETAIRDAAPFALAAYLMAGYPSMSAFAGHLVEVSDVADLVEVGVPFTDPMADGLTIQKAADRALEHGTTLPAIFDTLTEIAPDLRSPVLLMGYTNPFLSYGPERTAERMAAAGVSGAIVPDLPSEEQALLSGPLAHHGLAVIDLVTPATPEPRLSAIADRAEGFVYAVTVTGTTGGSLEIPADLLEYLDTVRQRAGCPVLAGFGIRSAAQVKALAPHVDGAVVGTALIDGIDRGIGPGEVVRQLRVGV